MLYNVSQDANTFWKISLALLRFKSEEANRLLKRFVREDRYPPVKTRALKLLDREEVQNDTSG